MLPYGHGVSRESRRLTAPDVRLQDPRGVQLVVYGVSPICPQLGLGTLRTVGGGNESDGLLCRRYFRKLLLMKTICHGDIPHVSPVDW